MWSFRPPEIASTYHQRKWIRFSLFFRWKYTAYLLAAVLGSVLVVGDPLYHFLNQNFEIFLNLSYEQAPELLEHLEREQSWLIMFFIASLVSLSVFCLYFGLHVTQRMIRPLEVFDRRLKALCRGEFSASNLKLREKDEFHELLESLNALQKYLKQTAHDDLLRLIDIWKKTESLEVKRETEEMIREEQKVLGHYSANDYDIRRFIENFSSLSEVPDSRRAS